MERPSEDREHEAVLSRLKLYSFWINDVQAAGLKAIKRAKDISGSEQIGQALNDWLEKNGVTATKTERRRTGIRKRS